MIIFESVSGQITCGNQVFPLDNSNVIAASCKRQACKDGTFEIGGVYAASLNLTCRLPSSANPYNIRGAECELYSQYASESEPHCIGKFWITSAKRTGNIFTLSSMDGIMWLDTSGTFSDDQGKVFSSLGTYFEAGGYHGTICDWGRIITNAVCDLTERMTGISNALQWADFSASYNGQTIYYNNQHYYNSLEQETSDPCDFGICTDSGVSDTNTPRDLFRMLGALAGGFIYVRPDGNAIQKNRLTLGQFGFPGGGVSSVEVFNNEIEFDSFDIADFELHLSDVLLTAEIKNAWTEFATKISSSPPNFRYVIDSNPFLDSLYGIKNGDDNNREIIDSVKFGLYRSVYTYLVPIYHRILPVRPFHCTVHAEKRFHLGQMVFLHYQRPGETTPSDYVSIITSIQWTFRGGYTISCGGEDTRVMAECVRPSKGDKAIIEARNRCRRIRLQCAELEEKYAELSDRVDAIDGGGGGLPYTETPLWNLPVEDYTAGAETVNNTGSAGGQIYFHQNRDSHSLEESIFPDSGGIHFRYYGTTNFGITYSKYQNWTLILKFKNYSSESAKAYHAFFNSGSYGLECFFDKANDCLNFRFSSNSGNITVLDSGASIALDDRTVVMFGVTAQVLENGYHTMAFCCDGTSVYFVLDGTRIASYPLQNFSPFGYACIGCYSRYQAWASQYVADMTVTAFAFYDVLLL